MADEHDPLIQIKRLKTDGELFGAVCFNRLGKVLLSVVSGLSLLIAGTLISAAGAQINKLNDLNDSQGIVAQKLSSLEDSVSGLARQVETNRRESRQERRDLQERTNENARALATLRAKVEGKGQ